MDAAPRTPAPAEARTYTLRIPSDLDFIPPVRQFIAEVARAEGFPKKFCFRTEVIVDELCTNAVIHGSPDLNSQVAVEAAFDGGAMQLRVKDQGGPKRNVEDLKKAVYRPESRSAGRKGRGLAIVQMLSDELRIQVDARGYTQVNVVKAKGAAGEGAGGEGGFEETL